jgi:hypothetical protein
MVYLHGGGAIGPDGAVRNVDVGLSGALAHYNLLLPENHDQLVRGVRASLHVSDVAPIKLRIRFWPALTGRP